MAAKRRRGNGAGSLYRRREGGPWVASWWDAEGKRHTRSTGTTDRRAAERILSKRVEGAALRREGIIDPRADARSAAERRPLSEHLA